MLLDHWASPRHHRGAANDWRRYRTGVSTPYVDPGWGPVLRIYPKLIVPFIGMRAMVGQASGLQSMRMVWLGFANVLMIIWIPVLLFGQRQRPARPLHRHCDPAMLGVFANCSCPDSYEPDVSSPGGSPAPTSEPPSSESALPKRRAGSALSASCSAVTGSSRSSSAVSVPL